MRLGVHRFIRLIAMTVSDLIRAPRRGDGSRWVIAMAAAIATVVIAYDRKWPLQDLLRGTAGVGFVSGLARTASAFGEGWVVTLLGVVALAVGVGLRRQRVVDAAMVLGAGGFMGWLLVVAAQFVFAESRPIDGGAMRWFSLHGHGVSGHASAAALLLGPVRVLTAERRRALRASATVAIVGWALLVGWSRVWLDMHFVWNVVLGLFLGWAAAGAAFAAWHGEPDRRACR